MLISRRSCRINFLKTLKCFVRQIKRFFATCLITAQSVHKFNEYCPGLAGRDSGSLKLRDGIKSWVLRERRCRAALFLCGALLDNVRKGPGFHSVGHTAKVDYPGSTILTSWRNFCQLRLCQTQKAIFIQQHKYLSLNLCVHQNA